MRNKNIVILIQSDFGTNSPSARVGFGNLIFRKFIISKLNYGEDFLPYSVFASPSMYLEKTLRRAYAEYGKANSYIFINPEISEVTQKNCLQKLFGKFIKYKSSSAKIIYDKNAKIPVAYFFPGKLIFSRIKQIENLRFLSCLDASLDKKLLEKVTGKKVFTDSSKFEISLKYQNFYNSDSNIGKLILNQCERATKLFHNKNCLYFLPYEAGDLLFAGLALKGKKQQNIQIACLEKYAPILRRVNKESNIFPLTIPINDDTRKKESEAAIFNKYFLMQVPANYKYCFLRPLRGHEKSNIHLIDQLALAFGADTQNKYSQAKAQLRKAPHNKKIFCHFEAGWKTKEYPMVWRQRLIDFLGKLKYEIVVLESNKYVGATSSPFLTIHGLERELADGILFIGMDSFPIHFATLVLGIPGLELFGPTKSINAVLERGQEHVKYESVGLTCSPCGQINYCNKFHADICLNYLRPEAVFEKVKRML